MQLNPLERRMSNIRLVPKVVLLMLFSTVLLLAKLCDDEGLFEAFGTLMARGSRGDPKALLRQVAIGIRLLKQGQRIKVIAEFAGGAGGG